jgi:YidC/Oxa1 family membrane protein insertase
MEQRTLGDYKIIKSIGQGTLGSTFLAEHRFMKRQFVLKVLPEELSSDRSFIQRFEEDVGMLASFEHPNIVKIYNISFDQGQYFLVTDCIVDDLGETTNLAQYVLSLRRALEEEEIFQILRQVADALDYIHAKKSGGKGFVHRGLKLNNILVGKGKQDIEIHLSDLGISRIIGPGAVLTRTYKTVAEALGIALPVAQKAGSDRYPSPPIDQQKLIPLHISFLQNYAFLAPEQKRLDSNHPYQTPSAEHDEGVKRHEKGKLGGYYPLLRRDLIEIPPKKSIMIEPKYYALNIVSDYPETAEISYDVKHFDERSIIFESVQSHRKITKTYTIGDADHPDAPYSLNLNIAVEGDSRGLWLTSGVPEVEWISGGIAPSLKYRQTRNKKSEVEKIELPKDVTTVTSAYLDWISNSNGFLGMIMDPLKDSDPGYRVQFISGSSAPSRLLELADTNEKFTPENLPGYMTLLPLNKNGGNMSFRFFGGPFDTGILKEVDKLYSDSATGYNPQYIDSQTMHGWFTFISEPFAKFLFVLLNFFHNLTGSWAFSIVLLTVCLRLMLYPLNAWSTKSMVKMQQIAPEVTAIQEKYKKDPKKAQLEIMHLYRERGVNPASGCLPLLIQMPFLIGMFDLLKSSFALRGAPFIPGWIDDLTAPDVLFRWKTPIFFIGTEFHLLPILLGVVMFFQQRLMATGPKDPNLMTDQQRQQRTMGTVMTVVFTVMFYNFPSGLNIYWLSSMLLGMLQQWITSKRLKNEPVAVTSQPPPKKGKNR